MIENIEAIEGSLGIEAGTLTKAIESDEKVSIEVPKGKVVDPETHEIITKDDYRTRIDNIKADSEVVGVEKAVKHARTKHELDFEGSRKGDGENIEILLQSFSKKALSDAGTEPDKKIGELEKDKGILQDKAVTLQDKIDELLLSNTQKDAQRQIETNILSGIPDNLTLSKEQVMTLFLADYSVENDNGKQVVKKGGETLKNESTLDPLLLGDVIKTYSETFAKGVEGGAGKGSTVGDPKGGSMALFTKEMNDAGHTTGSEHFNREMQKRITDGSLKL